MLPQGLSAMEACASCSTANSAAVTLSPEGPADRSLSPEGQADRPSAPVVSTPSLASASVRQSCSGEAASSSGASDNGPALSASQQQQQQQVLQPGSSGLLSRTPLVHQKGLEAMEACRRGL